MMSRVLSAELFQTITAERALLKGQQIFFKTLNHANFSMEYTYQFCAANYLR